MQVWAPSGAIYYIFHSLHLAGIKAAERRGTGPEKTGANNPFEKHAVHLPELPNFVRDGDQ